MKQWPVPNSYSKKIPISGYPSSFWEDRADRFHCGIDIYAPGGSDVLAIEDGNVINIGAFTSPKILSYWNTTYYILIKNKTRFFCKYAELEDIVVSVGETVRAGQLIGHVGLVLNSDKITEKTPLYIQKINKNKKHSMLHFELYKKLPNQNKKYLGGNWFGNTKPKNLLDPTIFLIQHRM